MSKEKILRKVLRSLPKRFNIKITAIEEVHDLSKMNADELIKSLLSFELCIVNFEKMTIGVDFKNIITDHR